MGISSDGILVLGISLTDEESELLPWHSEETDGDMEDWIASESGLQKPEGQDYKSEEWAKYWERRRQAVSVFPIDEVIHCSDSYPMSILALRGTDVKAYRGSPKVIDPETLTAERDESKRWLREFCEKYGIAYREPQWLLCSYYG